MSQNNRKDTPKFIDNWRIICVLGEGAFGQVYCVQNKNNKQGLLYAMKVEQKQQNRNDEVLRMEVQIMDNVKGRFFCDIIHKGQTEKITFIVMTLLGKPLDEIRRAQPGRRFSVASGIKIGMQMLRAFKKLHYAGYIHRDVKPANMAPSYNKPQMVCLFDFGLARYIFVKNNPGEWRQARSRVAFRGTYRYCSVNAHMCRDQGRVDDLWGLLYSLIELCTGTLPWTGMRQVESLSIKTDISDDELFAECPLSFRKFKKKLSQWKFEDQPEYEPLLFTLYKEIFYMGEGHNHLTDPFEWQENPKYMDPFTNDERQREEDEDTLGTIESEYESEYESRVGESTRTRTVDDTLDDLNDEYLMNKTKKWDEQQKLKKETESKPKTAEKTKSEKGVLKSGEKKSVTKSEAKKKEEKNVSKSGENKKIVTKSEMKKKSVSKSGEKKKIVANSEVKKKSEKSMPKSEEKKKSEKDVKNQTKGHKPPMFQGKTKGSQKKM